MPGRKSTEDETVSEPQQSTQLFSEQSIPQWRTGICNAQPFRDAVVRNRRVA
jgi:hypothetical protein